MQYRSGMWCWWPPVEVFFLDDRTLNELKSRADRRRNAQEADLARLLDELESLENEDNRDADIAAPDAENPDQPPDR